MKLPSRLLPLIIVTIALFASVMLFSPQQLPVLQSKVLHVTLAGVVAFWLDVLFFPYARPDSYLVETNWMDATPKRGDADHPIVCGYRLTFNAAMLRRAIIVGSAMIAIGLGA